MKIIRRHEFLKLPRGIVFGQGKPWYFDGWSIKGESSGNDFYCTPLDWTQFESHSSADMMDKADTLLSTSASVPMLWDADQRDGLFDDEHIYCVLEQSDIDSLIAVLQKANGI
jgi:hypothetical protein